jgi:hypothetical protein
VRRRWARALRKCCADFARAGEPSGINRFNRGESIRAEVVRIASELAPTAGSPDGIREGAA